MNLTKKDIRQIVYSHRSNLEESIKKQWDSVILTKLLQSNFYKNSKVIFTYVSFQGEVDTIKFIEKALSQGKILCVPKVISKEHGMQAYKITSFSDLQKGSYGILEPKDQSQLILPTDIDLLVMPGVAFDKNNGRIGYGGGYYDRFLKKIDSQAHKVALAYDFQIFDEIPMDDFDERVDFIIRNDL